MMQIKILPTMGFLFLHHSTYIMGNVNEFNFCNLFFSQIYTKVVCESWYTKDSNLTRSKRHMRSKKGDEEKKYGYFYKSRILRVRKLESNLFWRGFFFSAVVFFIQRSIAKPSNWIATSRWEDRRGGEGRKIDSPSVFTTDQLRSV